MLAGAIMETGGISRQLIDFSDSLVGWVPGGLACACIVASMFFAGISGSAAADTAAIGAVVIPAMIRQGYPPAFAAAVVAAGGSIGVIIPPSIPMVIFGFLTNVSIAKLFAGGMMVGVLFGCSFMAVSIWICRRKGYGLRQTLFAATGVGIAERSGMGAWRSRHRAGRDSVGHRHGHRGGGPGRLLRPSRQHGLQPRAEVEGHARAHCPLPDHGRNHPLYHCHGQGLYLADRHETDDPARGRRGYRAGPAALGTAASGHGGTSGYRLRHGNHGGPDTAGSGSGRADAPDGR